MGGLFGLCLSCVIILLFPTSSVHTDFQKELILTKDNFNSELSQGKLEIYSSERNCLTQWCSEAREAETAIDPNGNPLLVR